MDITLSIVGTAFRKEEKDKCSKQIYEAMCFIAKTVIDQCNKFNYPITTLVSGGAAGADHVAVTLYLNNVIPNLKLYLPCEYVNGEYIDNGIENSNKNPGGIANHYHRNFQKCTGINSLSDIQAAISRGAQTIPIKGGFFARNVMVAKSDFILAMTFGNGNEVKPGGTSHTIECYLNRVKTEGIFDKSFHYDLNSGKLFFGCRLPKYSTNKNN